MHHKTDTNNAIGLTLSVIIWKFSHCTSSGTMCFNTIEDHTRNSKLFPHITSDQSTRAMKKDFLDKYSHLARIPKSVLRNIHKTILDQIVLDLCELNGNPNSTRLDLFWDELAQYLEDTTMTVDERRHTTMMHMSIAISMHNLRHLQKQHLNLPPCPIA